MFFFSLLLSCSFVKWMKWPMGNWKQMVNDEKKKMLIASWVCTRELFLTQLEASGDISRTLMIVHFDFHSREWTKKVWNQWIHMLHLNSQWKKRRSKIENYILLSIVFFSNEKNRCIAYLNQIIRCIWYRTMLFSVILMRDKMHVLVSRLHPWRTAPCGVFQSSCCAR